MPSATDFKKAFGLAGKVTALGGDFEVENCHVGHEVKEESERYEFPTELTVSWIGGSKLGAAKRQKQLQQAWKQLVQEHIVYSAYGSPYECSYGSPRISCLDEEGAAFRLTCLGKAVRRRDIPTLGQRKAAEREERGVPEDVSAEDKAQYLQGYRVIKSRFGSSTCPLCGHTIDQGVKIAKREGEQARGGWAHATCLVVERKGQQKQGGRAGRAGRRPPAATATAAAKGATGSKRGKGGREAEAEAGGEAGVQTRKKKAGAVPVQEGRAGSMIKRQTPETGAGSNAKRRKAAAGGKGTEE